MEGTDKNTNKEIITSSDGNTAPAVQGAGQNEPMSVKMILQTIRATLKSYKGNYDKAVELMITQANQISKQHGQGKKDFKWLIKTLEEMEAMIGIELTEEEFQAINKSAAHYLMYNEKTGHMPGGKGWQKSRFIRYAKYSCDPKEWFEIPTFPFLQEGEVNYPILKPGTVNYIGARPGVGKTTAAITILVDAINAGRKVIYLTADERPEVIHSKVLAAWIYKKWKPTDTIPLPYDRDKIRKLLPSLKNLTIPTVNSVIFAAAASDRMQITANFDKKTITGNDQAAPDEYKTYMRCMEAIDYFDKILVDQYSILSLDSFYDDGWDRLKYTLDNLDPGSLVVIDYIQAVDIIPGLAENPRMDALTQKNKLISAILNTAQGTKNIYLCAAQLNRTPNESEISQMELSSFAESGKIEQTAELAIGLSRVSYKGESRIYYRIMKNRSAAPTGNYWMGNTRQSYQYSTLEPDLDIKNHPIETGTTEDYKKGIDGRVVDQNGGIDLSGDDEKKAADNKAKKPGNGIAM